MSRLLSCRSPTLRTHWPLIAIANYPGQRFTLPNAMMVNDNVRWSGTAPHH
jgi:hypothetical protein